MRKFNFIVMFLVCFLHISEAEEKKPNLLLDGGEKSLIATMDSFKIEIFDQVSGGCLPNPNKLKDKMEISIRKNGFKVSPKDALFSNRLIINALGYKTNNSSCVVYLSTLILRPSVIDVPFSEGQQTLIDYRYDVGSTLLSGDINGMQKRLEKQIQEYGDKLFLNISRAQDDIFTKFPSIKKNMENIRKPQ